MKNKSVNLVTWMLLVSQLALANPLTDLQNALRGAQRERDRAISALDNAREKVSRIERDISSAKNRLSDLTVQMRNEKGRLSSAKEISENLKNKVTAAKNRVTQLLQDVSGGNSLVSSLYEKKRQIEAQMTALNNQYKALLDQALDTEMIAYSVTTEGKLSYNFQTGSFYGKVDLTNGLTLDNKKIEDWLSGTFAIPQGNPVQLAISLASMQQMEHSTGYFSARKNFFNSQGPVNAYYASERFVDWASAEMVAHHVALGIVTSGQSVQQSVREAQDQILLEFNDILSWLKESGKDNLEAAATCALSRILGQSCAALGPMQFSIRGDGISCSYKGKSSWMTTIPERFLPGLQIPPVTASLSSSHLGFGISWSLGLAAPSSLKSRIERFSNQPGLQAEAEAIFKRAVERLMANPSEKVQKYLGGFNYAEVAGGLQKRALSTRLIAGLGINTEDLLSRFQEGNPIIDLKGTRIANLLEARLKPLALGNQGKATLTQLEFDLSKMALTATVSLLHRQSWGRLEDAASALNDWFREKGMQLRVGAMELIQSSVKATLDTLANKAAALRAPFNEAKAKVDSAVASLEATKRKLETARSEVTSAQDRLDGILAQVRSISAAVSQMERNVREATDKVAALSSERDRLVREAERCRSEVTRWRNEVSRLEDKIRSWVPPTPSLPSLPSIPTGPISIPRPHWP